MDEVTESQLESLMKHYGQKLEKQEELAKKQAEAAQSEFVKIRKEIIRPIMEEKGNKLKEHGHNYSIFEDYLIDWRTRGKKENIAMRITLAGKKDAWNYYNKSQITFSVQKGSPIIEVYQNIVTPKGGSGNLIKNIDITQIDKDMVEKLVLKFLKDVFAQNC